MKKNLFFILLFVSSYIFAQLPTTGLSSVYDFTGGDLTTSVGNNNFTQIGTNLLGTTDQFGSTGNAIQLNGDILERNPITNTGSQSSISFWIKTSTVDTNERVIFDQSNRSNLSDTYSSGISAYLVSGKIGFKCNYEYSYMDNMMMMMMIDEVSGYDSIEYTTSIADGNWHHIVLSIQASVTSSGMDDDVTNFYALSVDGSQVNSYAHTVNVMNGQGSTMFTSTYPNVDFIVGDLTAKNLSSTNKYQDEIDDIRIYDSYRLNSVDVQNINSYTPCKPQNVQVSNIGQTTADLSWDAPQMVTNHWEIALVPQAQPLSSGTYYSSNTNYFSFTGITISTPYDVYVRALCGGSYSDWTDAISFITMDPPAFVDLNATAGALNGTSWADAYTNIQDAIDNASSGQEIWVAQGTYYPTTNNLDPRKATYAIDKTLKIYGGFQGFETLVSQRDATANVTILSGDLNMDDSANISHNETTRSENAYHIITLKGDFNAGTLVNGFTITSGNANGTVSNVSGATGYDDRNGAAIYANPDGNVFKVSAEFKNCIIEKNTSLKHAVMGTYSPLSATGTYSKVDFTSTIIKNNSSNESMIGLIASSLYGNSRFGDIVNCLITDNKCQSMASPTVLYASASGVATIAPTCGFSIINTTIANNDTSSTWVLGFENIDVASKIDNSIVYNYGSTTNSLVHASGTNNSITSSNSIIEGGFLSAQNVDPKFKDMYNQDYSLDASSPAIDAGNNSLLSATITKDAAGNNRIENTTIDMGALEYFAPVVNYDLTVSKIGNGTINPTVGVHSYTSGSSVSITATPATGWLFDKWSGDLTSTNSSETITINSNKSVTAEFKQIQSVLTVNTNGNGTVTRNIQPVNGTYTYGTSVTLTASPATGFQFDGWSGASIQVSLSTVIIMDADKTVTANFSPVQYELTIIQNTGTVTPDSGSLANGVYIYNSGTSVIITATPNSGYVFDHYEITDSNGTTNSSTNPLSISMSDNISVEAVYTVAFNLTTSVVGSGFVSPNGTTTYSNGAIVTVTATPAAGWSFDSWSGASTSVAATINVTMNANKTLVANFIPIQYELTLIATYGTATPDSGSLNNGVYTYNNATSVIITATPNTSYVFDHFDIATPNGSTTSNTSPLTIVMNSNTAVEAVFVPIQYELTLIATNGTATPDSGSLSNGVYTYNNASSVIITATPNTGYAFDHFEITTSNGSTTSNTNPLTVVMNSNTAVEAVFQSTASVNGNEFVNLNIYPNPVKDILHIDLDKEIKNIEVFNILGAKLLESTQSLINTSNLSHGAYFIKITTKSGETTTKRFLKK